jgi:hypothetical protein
MKIDTLTFKTQPWEHQFLAVKFLMERKQAALYTDMGTGKSKVIIDMIVNKEFRTILIACTNKGCSVWETQVSLHSDIPPVNVLNLSGVATSKKVPLLKEKLTQRKQGNIRGPIVILVNYEGIWRNEFANFLLRKSTPIDCVVCDESHRIKSPGSKCSRFLAKLGKKVENRYLVTGTPLAENPMDAYAQYRFLDPSIFGTSFARFKDRYQNLDVRKSAAVGFPILDKKQPYKNLDELREKVFSVAFKIPSSVVLPEQNTRERRFSLTPKASKVYTKLCKDGVLTQGDWYCEAENALTLQIRKKQVASGFVSTVNEVMDKKIFRLDTTRKDTLKDLLEGLEASEPVVVFAQYTYDLRQVRRACEELGREYSELSGKEDTEAEWQAGKTTVLGVQFSKGSEGVDFTRSRYCIYYTMTDRLALYLQSKKRIHRPGQTRPVYYYHLIADLADGKPTIDSTVMEAVRLKRDIVEYVMEKEAP